MWAPLETCRVKIFLRFSKVRHGKMQNEMYGALAVLSLFLAFFVKFLIDMLGAKPSDGKKGKKVIFHC